MPTIFLYGQVALSSLDIERDIQQCAVDEYNRAIKIF